MGLTYKSRTIADAKVLDIFGVQGVGCYQLNFSLEFNLPNWEPADGKAVLGNLRADISVGANRENLKRIGYALPETPLPLETKEITQRQCIQFLLNLSEQQLFALEALRNGGGLYFRVTVSGEARGERDSQWAREDFLYEATISDWARVLQQLDYADILVIGVELPKAELGHKLRPVTKLIRDAHGDLLGGRYDSVVARCRQALEGVRKVLGQQDKSAGALEKFCKAARKTMTKHERELLVREAAYHYAHLAHHVDLTGAQQSYSRGDAMFLLAVASAAISSEIAEASAYPPPVETDQAE